MSNHIEDVRQELVGFELEALSLLIYRWAEPANVEKRKSEWEDKMPAFRRAIIAGKNTGTRRKLEPEIIRAEFACLRTVVEYVKSESKKKPGIFKDENDMSKLRIPYPVDNVDRIFGPFPLPRKELREIWNALINRSDDLDVVIYKIISRRFEVTHKTIKKYINSPDKERVKLSKNQQLLASIFLDICSDSDNNEKWQGLRAEILYTLYMSKPECNLIFIYYLVQTAHRLKKKLFVGEYDAEMIHKLCSIVCPDIKKLSSNPFVRLT